MEIEILTLVNNVKASKKNGTFLSDDCIFTEVFLLSTVTDKPHIAVVKNDEPVDVSLADANKTDNIIKEKTLSSSITTDPTINLSSIITINNKVTAPQIMWNHNIASSVYKFKHYFTSLVH